MEAIGQLDKAYNVSIERRVNELWMASFSLVKNDPKQYLCSHLNYIEITSPSGRYMGLYRIMPTKTRRNNSNDSIEYECEHVFATLLDDVIDGYHQFSNFSTTDVMKAILDMQTERKWEIGNIEFERYFHYSFENENGLMAPLLSIPKPFNEPYEFTFDTTVFPWRLNLERPSDRITSEIRWGKDMIDFEEVSDPSKIVNYIIPKGAGEGVNQLTIEEVNQGRRHLEDRESIEKWGIHKYIWIDKRFENASSLKENGQALLDQWKDPQISFECSSVDLSVKPEYSHERRLLNGVTKIIVDEREYLARIVAENITDLAKEWEVDYEINNKIDDIATTQADMERKQQVNDAYSQGATNILTFGYQDNADSGIPAVIPFYIDDDVVNVNTLELTFRTRPFRSYSRATEGGGAIVKSTSSGGGTVKSTSSGGGTTATSSSGGGVAKSTASGGGSTRTSSSGGGSTQTTNQYCGTSNACETGTGPQIGSGSDHFHRLPGQLLNHTHSVTVPNHTHSVSIPNHRHEFDVPNHKHDVKIPNHTHEIDIPDHTHEIELPNHTHEVKHEIIELSSTPSSVSIKVDGNNVSFDGTRADRLNLIDYIKKDSNGKITRGRHEIEILPSGLARIEADLILRVFIQSHLGGTY